MLKYKTNIRKYKVSDLTSQYILYELLERTCHLTLFYVTYMAMAGSSFGKLFTVTTWGESHGKGIGVVIDGCPAGLSLCEEDIQVFLNRRKPGQSKFTTPRKEDDTVEILSGVFERKTTGTPISMVVFVVLALAIASVLTSVVVGKKTN